MDINHLLATAVRAVREAGRIIKNDFEKIKPASYEYKKDWSIVTKTDLAAERIILKTIRGKFPGHSFFSEELGSDGRNSDFLWVIDPLDGTTNFYCKIPHFGVSVGLLYKEEPILGVVYQPLSKELFTAVKGRGAKLNGKKIRVSKKYDLEKSVIDLARGGRKEVDCLRWAKIFHKITEKTPTVRIYGAITMDLCNTARGRLDALIGVNCFLHDYVAAGLIAKEAGAIFTDFKGGASLAKKSDILAANPKLHRKLMRILKSI